MTGLDALAEAARLELAAVYSRPCTEHHAGTDPRPATTRQLVELSREMQAAVAPVDFTGEARRLAARGHGVIEIADMLGASIADVRAALRQENAA